MRRQWLIAAILIALCAALAGAQTCSCGANPPSPPNRTLTPYAGTPPDLEPFSNYTPPYYQHYTSSPEYNGPAREQKTVPAAAVDEVAIGFMAPLEHHKDQALGQAMLHGAQMAIDEANARGGYGGKPFALKIHDDSAIWGASSNELVKMVYDDKVWAMMSSLSADTTHIALRVSLARRTAHGQQRRHGPDHPRDHHPLDSDQHSGRPRAGLHAGAAHLYRPGTEAHRAAARQRTLRPLRAWSSSATRRGAWATRW